MSEHSTVFFDITIGGEKGKNINFKVLFSYKNYIDII